jgi:uncharacterized membrane protein YeaQ/YmgE (transglycosylase-associated protein family)
MRQGLSVIVLLGAEGRGPPAVPVQHQTDARHPSGIQVNTADRVGARYSAPSSMLQSLLVTFREGLESLLIVGVIAFAMAELIYGGQRTDSGALQFILFGLPGLVPALVASWLAHKYAEPQPQPAA